MKLPSLLKTRAVRSLVIFLASTLGMALLLVAGSDNPVMGLKSFFVTPFTNSYFLGNLLDSACVCGLAALGFLTGRKAGLFNLGGEGFMFAGALTTACLAPLFAGTGLAGSLLLLLAGTSVGCLAGLLADLLRRRLGIHEIISTYLLSLAFLSVGNSLIAGPLRNPEGNLLATRSIDTGLQALAVLPPSRLNLLFMLFPLAALILFVALGKSRWGYELRLLRANPELAVTQGLDTHGLRKGALVISSALPALAGAVLVLGSHHAAFSGISGGQGWNGIAVAMLAQDHPLASLASALFMAWMQSGLQSARVFSSLGSSGAMFMQGLMILAVALSMGRTRRTR